MTLFTANVAIIVERYFLMMAVIFVSFFAGVPILAIISVPIFLAAMMGITFFPKKEEKYQVAKKEVKEINKLHIAA